MISQPNEIFLYYCHLLSFCLDYNMCQKTYFSMMDQFLAYPEVRTKHKLFKENSQNCQINIENLQFFAMNPDKIQCH